MAGIIATTDGDIEAPDRVLVVVAHPDDIDFGWAGTIATLTDAGSVVEYCLVTSGDAGDDTLTMSPAELARLREAEQTAAAGEVGVSSLHWLHHADGIVEPTLLLRRDIARVIRMVRPDVVVTQSPDPDWDRIYGAHPDHLAVGRATMAAVYPDARNPRAFPELLAEGHEPHTVTEIWVGGNPNRYIDTTDQFHRKVAALRRHHSQTGRMDDLEERLREWNSGTALEAGMTQGRMAEGFRVVAAT